MLIIQGIIGAIDITRVLGQPLAITLKWKKSAGTGSTWMGPLAADLNNDGDMEIVISGLTGKTAALDPETGDVIWSVPYGGDHVPMEIVDLNKDDNLEIVMCPQYVNGSIVTGVMVLHGNNGSIYWHNRNAAGKGTYIAVGDINADGYPEIFSAHPGRVTALTYDGRIFASTYTYYTCYGGMSLADTNFDGIFEVYLGERSYSYDPTGRGLRAFWADNLTEIWAYPDILCSSQAPTIADVDNDGDLEIIILNQGTTSGGIAVFNTDGSVNTYKDIYRKKLNLGLPAHDPPTIADVDGDGHLELITARDKRQPKIWDLVDWKLDATLPFPCMHPPGLADVDGDGKWEILDCNVNNVTIFKYNSVTKNYDIIGTINLPLAHAFFIAQDIDADGKLELVFNQHNSWISVYDVEAPAPNPLPQSGLCHYHQYRGSVPAYRPPPEQPPRISEIAPKDGATNVPVTLSELSCELKDFQNDLMNYTVTTNPDIIGGLHSGTNVPSGTKITIPVISNLTPSTTYTWNVTATDGTCTTTRTFTFYTEGNVTLTISTVHGSVTKKPASVDNVYPYGTLVWLTAVADTGYTFSYWDGDLASAGSNNPATILMNGNKNVTAIFVGPRLRTYVSPTGSGTIIKIPDQTNYDYLSTVELTAVPNAGWSFSYWSIANDTSGSPTINSTENPITIVMDNNKRVTAVFTEIPAVQYELIISVSGNGTTNPAPGSYLYGEGTVASVTAIPDSGWTFDHWVLDNVDVGSNNPYDVTMDGNHTLEAVFVEIPPPPQYELVISVSGNGMTSPAPGTYIYDAGTAVEVTAVPDSGWEFDHWVLDGVNVGAMNPYTVTLDNNHTLEAVFTEVIQPTQYQLTISVSGNGATDPAEGTYTYNEGTVVQVTAYPTEGWRLDHWLLDSSDVGDANPYVVTMDGNHTLTAVFVQEEYVLTINVSPEGSGTIILNNTGPYYYGDAVQLTAEPNTGWYFSHWEEEGIVLGNQNPIVIIIDGNTSITAVFTQEIIQWWSPYWQYRRTITIDHTKVAGELTDFPVLIEITDGSLAGKAQLDGDDFVFTDENNTKLDHQIELYDGATGHLIAWVKVPHLSSATDTVLYLYYGNPNCTSQQNPTGVWDANYKLVMHLNEETGILYDSTINGNNGLPYGSLVQGATGHIGGCVEFNGGYVQLPRIFTTETQFTFSAWIYPRAGARYFISQYQSPYQGVFLQVYSDNRIELYVNNIIVSKSITINNWYYVVATFNGTTATLYVNEGSPVSRSASNPIWVSPNMYLGDRSDHVRKFYGFIDEVRASDIARSPAWILTEYNNQLNPSAFYTIGPEEQYPGTAQVGAGEYFDSFSASLQTGDTNGSEIQQEANLAYLILLAGLATISFSFKRRKNRKPSSSNL